MPIILRSVTASNASSGGSTSLTFSYTVSTTRDRLFFVGSRITAGTNGSASYAGQAMTRAANVGSTSLWFRVNPISGTNNVVLDGTVTFTTFLYTVLELSNVNQQTAIGAVRATSGFGTSASTPNLPVPRYAETYIYGIVSGDYTVSPGLWSGTSPTISMAGNRASINGHNIADGHLLSGGSLNWTRAVNCNWESIAVQVMPAYYSQDYPYTKDSITPALATKSKSWIQQPVGPAQLNFDNSITRGLRAWRYPNGSDSSWSQATALPTKANGTKGQVDRFNLVSFQGLQSSKQLMYWPSTMFVLFRRAAASENQGLASLGNLNISGILLSVDSSNNLAYYVEDGGSFETITTPLGTDTQNYKTVVARSNSNEFGESDYHDLWLDGSKKSSSTTVLFDNELADKIALGYMYYEGGSGPFFRGDIALALFWDRFLTDEEVMSITANPWQVFARPSDNRAIVTQPRVTASIKSSYPVATVAGFTKAQVAPFLNATRKSKVTQPQGPQLVNWDNQLTSGLSQLLTPSAGGYYDAVAGVHRAATGADLSLGTSAQGKAMIWSGQTADSYVDAGKYLYTTSGTVFFLVVMGTTGIVRGLWSSANTASNSRVTVRITNTNKLNLNVNGVATVAEGTTNVTAGIPFALACSWSDSGGAVDGRCYVNGRLDARATAASQPTQTGINSVWGYASPSSARMLGSMALGGYVNRVWSDEEHRLFAEKPWALLTSAVPHVWGRV